MQDKEAEPSNEELNQDVEVKATRSRGVIYVVTGGRSYIGELMTSVASLRKHEPNLPILVFTDFPIPKRYELDTERLEFNDNAHKLKVASLRRSPFEETLFLDTDTQIRGSLDPLFDELEGKDFCAANAHSADYTVRPPRWIGMVKEGEYNTGVLLFRKSKATSDFLASWESAVRAHDSNDMWAGHFGDQYFFNNLVQNGAAESLGLRWGILENWRWNCRGLARPTVESEGRWSDVRIHHERTKSMKFRKFVHSFTNVGMVRIFLDKVVMQTKRVFTSSSETKSGES